MRSVDEVEAVVLPERLSAGREPLGVEADVEVLDDQPRPSDADVRRRAVPDDRVSTFAVRRDEDRRSFGPLPVSVEPLPVPAAAASQEQVPTRAQRSAAGASEAPPRRGAARTRPSVVAVTIDVPRPLRLAHRSAVDPQGKGADDEHQYDCGEADPCRHGLAIVGRRLRFLRSVETYAKACRPRDGVGTPMAAA